MRAYLWATLDEGVRGRGVSHTGLMGMVESECAVRTMWCVYGVRHGREREHGSVRASAFNILNMLLLAMSPTFFSCARRQPHLQRSAPGSHLLQAPDRPVACAVQGPREGLRCTGCGRDDVVPSLAPLTLRSGGGRPCPVRRVMSHELKPLVALMVFASSPCQIQRLASLHHGFCRRSWAELHSTPGGGKTSGPPFIFTKMLSMGARFFLARCIDESMMVATLA